MGPSMTAGSSQRNSINGINVSMAYRPEISCRLLSRMGNIKAHIRAGSRSDAEGILTSSQWQEKRFPLQEKPPLKCCSGWMVTSIHLVRQFPSAVELPSPLAYYSWKSWIWTHRIRINTIRWSRDTRKSQRQRLITKLDSVRHHCRCRFFRGKRICIFSKSSSIFLHHISF